MKPLKKNPLVQRMEDMTFPITKASALEKMMRKMWAHHYYGKRAAATVVERTDRDKVLWTGREWLRSINDDNGFTLMPRIVWRVVAVVILGLAIIISFYIYGKR